MQLEPGADVTVINREAWDQIRSPTLEKTTTSLGAANGTPIEVWVNLMFSSPAEDIHAMVAAK